MRLNGLPVLSIYNKKFFSLHDILDELSKIKRRLLDFVLRNCKMYYFK